MIVPAMLALTVAGASAYTLTGFRTNAPVDMKLPAIPDSLQKENPFDRAQLLKMRAAASLAEMGADWTTILPDTSGSIKTPEAEKDPQLRSYRTRLRAERFAKGKLVLNTASMADLLVNGESKATKEKSDSLPSDITAQLELSPEADYEIEVVVLTFPDDKGEAGFKLEFIPDEEYKDVKIQDSADMKRRFSPLTTMIGERITSVALSPDGKYLLTRYAETVSAAERYSRAEVTETATGKEVMEAPGNADWMPTGSTLYYTDKAKRGYNVMAQKMPETTARKVVENVPDGNVSFTPDGKYLVYYNQVDGPEDTGVMRRVKTQDDRIPGDRDRSYLMRYDIARGVAQPLTYGGASTVLLDFSRDGRKMLYLAAYQTPSEYPFYLNSIIEMDMTTLKTDTIIKDNGYVSAAIYSPDAKQLFVTGSPQAFGDLGVNAGDAEIPNAFDNQGYIYTIADGSVKAVTRDFDPSLQGEKIWNAATGKIYFLGETGFHKYVYELDPKSGKISQLESKIGSVTNYSIGEEHGTWLAYTGGDFTDTGMGYVMNLRTGKSRLIADPMASTLAGIEFGKMEPWQFTASDGTLIDGYMCLPPEFDPNKKYPLIVYYYGGTSPSTAAMHHLYSPQVFASRDYVVYVVNPSGTTGYGQEFSARHVNAWGKRTADDIIEGVKKFCKEHSFVDEKKIGCLGASYGGFMTQYLQTQTDIFAAAVSHAGISNVTSYWGEGYWGYSYNSIAAAKSYPWTDPELYTKQGSLFNADKIHTPLLLLHGKLDTNVPIGESIQLFNALRILGRDVEFITVEDENHVISNFDRKQAWQNTIMAWFAKYLQDDPRWWDALYGN